LIRCGPAGFLLVCFLVIGYHGLFGSVVINEFMASNGITIPDEDADFEDWIELYNRGDETVDIQGYYLSDDADNPHRWRFPSVEIPPGGFLLVFASGKDRFGPELHTNFRIAAAGEPLLLSDPDGELLDFIPALELDRDVSFGRIPDGGADFRVFDIPSPGQPNIPPLSAELSFSHTSGFYQQSFELEIMQSDDNIQIFYTTNGNIPDTADFVYDGPVELLNSDELENNPIIHIPTNPGSTHFWYRWRPPGEDLLRGHVIRARAFEDGIPVSDVITGTYFIDENIEDRFELPVISIVIEEESLFDHNEGLFVPGKTYEENPSELGNWSNGNFQNRGREWEREADFFFFDENPEQGIEQRVGIRIHGGGSRAFPLKSLRLYAREGYGNEYLEYPFFDKGPQKFRRLLLRNSGQDFVRTMYMDGLTHLLIEDIGLEHQRYRPAVLFINGAYWGIINIRDRFDKHHFSINHDVEEENLDLLEFGGFDVIEGERENYLDMMEYVRNHPMSDDYHYQVIEGWMDIDNFIDYYIAKMFIATYDWPGNNIRFWRDRSVDGKWRWIYFDNDDALTDLHFNPYEHLMDLTDNPWPNPLWSTELFRNLLDSDLFRHKFVDGINYHLSNTFDRDRTVPMANQVAGDIRSEMKHHFERWKFPDSFGLWEDYNYVTVSFLEQRPCLFLEMSMEFFGLDYQLDSLEYCFSGTETELSDSDFTLFPNPTRSYLNVQTSIRIEIQGFRITDVSGRLIKQSRQPGFLYPGQKMPHFCR
jgi:hypothetical protein